MTQAGPRFAAVYGNTLKENADYPYYMVRDRFAGAEGRSQRSVKRGQGKVIEQHGAKAAAYRAPDGASDAALGHLHPYGLHRPLE